MTFLRMERLCRLAYRAGLTLADGPAEPQWTNGLVASPRESHLTREGRTTTCLIAAQPVNLSRSEPTGLGLLVIEGVFDLSERT